MLWSILELLNSLILYDLALISAHNMVFDAFKISA